jgi:hypothetical protein
MCIPNGRCNTCDSAVIVHYSACACACVCVCAYSYMHMRMFICACVCTRVEMSPHFLLAQYAAVPVFIELVDGFEVRQEGRGAPLLLKGTQNSALFSE